MSASVPPPTVFPHPSTCRARVHTGQCSCCVLQHVFCGDCVSLWFDRERTCPMCRTVIADKPLWRDGATSAAVQIY